MVFINLIFTGIQLLDKEKVIILDLMVYNILVKMDNYILLKLLN